MKRRDFFKLSALFVPAVAAPTVAYSFIWAKPDVREAMDKLMDRMRWTPVPDARPRIYHPDDFELRVNGIPIEAIDSWEITGEPPKVVARLKGNLRSIVIKGTVSI